MTRPLNIKQEFDSNGLHRLVHDDGRTTQWAAYRSFTYLDGYVGHTAFWGITEDICTADEFCKLAGTGR